MIRLVATSPVRAATIALAGVAAARAGASVIRGLRGDPAGREECGRHGAEAGTP